MNQTQQNGCDYQNSFYSNGFHDMGHGHVVSNMNLANVTSSQSSVYGNGTSNHIAKDQSTSICNLKSTIIDSNESERLSESSESGIGEENTESSSTNSSPNGKHPRILRLVQTQVILFCKSMSERVGSDIQRPRN